jgi:uncharacterized membrane protein YkoI
MTTLLLSLASVTVFWVQDVRAQEMAEWWPRQQYYMQSEGVSLDQAAQMAQSRFNAKVVKAETVRDGGRQVHLIRLFNPQNNKVWQVRVDAETGQMF